MRETLLQRIAQGAVEVQASSHASPSGQVKKELEEEEEEDDDNDDDEFLERYRQQRLEELQVRGGSYF